MYCEMLTSYLTCLYNQQKLPSTLVRGDLHSSNICHQGQPKDDFTIFDWATATIDLPLWDMRSLSNWVPSNETNEKNIDPYLALWKDYVTIDELKGWISFGKLKDQLSSLLEEYERKQSCGDVASVKERAEDLFRILRNMQESMNNAK